MLLLTSVSDLVTVVTGSAGAIKVHASWVDNTTTAVTPGRTNTASIASATTTTVVGAPDASTQRNVRKLSIHNDHASISNAITVNHTDGTNVEPLWNGTLLPNETIVLDQEGRWTYYGADGSVKPYTAKLQTMLRVTADVINATTSFADITGLTVALKSGRFYGFHSHLYHISNATTTGAQFGYNIDNAPTTSILGTIDTVTASITASVHSAGVVTARDTAATAQTTGSAGITLAILSGMIQPSADGTFAMRCKSEVAVAAGLTIKAGSWLHIWEFDN